MCVVWAQVVPADGRPDVELDLAAGHLFHVVMDFLHDLEHRVTNSKNPDGLSVEHARRLARNSRSRHGAGDETSDDEPACRREPLSYWLLHIQPPFSVL